MSRSTSNIIKASNLGPTSGLPTRKIKTNAASGGHQSQDTAEITLHRQGDIIEAIEVICSCGRTTLIECVYENQETTS